MELRVDIGRWRNLRPKLENGCDEYFCFGRELCEELYSDTLKYYRYLHLEDVSHIKFYEEYMWCVYVSGFNSKIVDQQFSLLKEAYGSWVSARPYKWQFVQTVNKNKRKFDAVCKTMQLLRDNLPWSNFKEKYLSSVDKIGKLPFMGPVMRYHLARNIGLDAVKPDRHLVRLAKHFGFKDAYTMCEYLSKKYDERIGVVDLILFYTASTYGTRELI